MASSQGPPKLEMTFITFTRLTKRVDEQLVYKYVHAALIRLWKESIRSFVRTAVQNIVIDTGMSYASLLPLGAQVRIRNEIEAGMIGIGAPKTGFKNLHGAFADNNARFKSKTLGEQLGRTAFDITFGTPTSPNLEFSFHIVVFQHFLQDVGGRAQNSGNWQSISKGRTAFLETFNAGLKSGKYLNGFTIAKLLLGFRLNTSINDLLSEE